MVDRVIALHLTEDDMSIDRGQAKISLLLLPVLFVGHLVTHVVSENSHGFLANLTVLELFVTLANFAHFRPNRVILFLLLVVDLLLLLHPSLSLSLSNCHLFYLVLRVFSVFLKLLELFINFELFDELRAQSESCGLMLGGLRAEGDGLVGVTLAFNHETWQLREGGFRATCLIHGSLMHHADLCQVHLDAHAIHRFILVFILFIFETASIFREARLLVLLLHLLDLLAESFTILAALKIVQIA